MELLSDLAREDSFSQCRQCLLSHAGGEGFLTWLCTYTYAAVQAAQQVGQRAGNGWCGGGGRGQGGWVSWGRRWGVTARARAIGEGPYGPNRVQVIA